MSLRSGGHSWYPTVRRHSKLHGIPFLLNKRTTTLGSLRMVNYMYYVIGLPEKFISPCFHGCYFGPENFDGFLG